MILNTMCEANQERFDQECPDDFQSAAYLSSWGQLDLVLEEEGQEAVEETVARVAGLLLGGVREGEGVSREQLLATLKRQQQQQEGGQEGECAADMQVPFDYRNSVR